MNHTSAATTRTRPGAHLPQARHSLEPGQAITSAETLLPYRIERLLGEGGFGQVYLAKRLGRSTVVPSILCIKVSEHITARTLNPLAAPSDILAGAAPKWQARDDVYQVGQPRSCGSLRLRQPASERTCTSRVAPMLGARKNSPA